ncbi:MAG: Icc protein [Candidatus Latescibacterota bacterium]|jgi:Icc protein
MKFIYFTDIHLCQGEDSPKGVELCFESMLSHNPEFLINGGDLGITEEAINIYKEVTKDISLPLFMCNGNHEMCSGYLPQEQAGTTHYSTDINGAHIVVLDVVRYNEPSDEHPRNWYGLADSVLLSWLENDLKDLPPETPLIVVSHIPLSTTFPFRMGRASEIIKPTNAVTNADKVLDLLRPFKNVATLHGHDHENCRHFVDHIEIMTTNAVAGNWWKASLNSFSPHGNEPQGYRLLNIDNNGTITSQYIAFQPQQHQIAELYQHPKSNRCFINVFDGSPKTRVVVPKLGTLPIIDPNAESSIGLSNHLYELPKGFRIKNVVVDITLDDIDSTQTQLNL